MLGELVYCSDRDGKLRRQERYGLTVLRAAGGRPGGWGETGRWNGRPGVGPPWGAPGAGPGGVLPLGAAVPVGAGAGGSGAFPPACAGWAGLGRPPPGGIMPQQGTVALRGPGWTGTWSGRQSSCVPGCGMWLSPHRWEAGTGRMAAAGVRRTHPAGQGRHPSGGVLLTGRARWMGGGCCPCSGRSPGWPGSACGPPLWSRRTGKSSL